MRKNLTAAMNGKELTGQYEGYTSCPLVISPKECILAEFDFQAPPQPLETFPYNGAKPRRSAYMMKAHAMPQIYWRMMLKYVS
jgi:sulfide:quinone oxidoreductase